MSEERKVEFFEMNHDEIPNRYMALCVWVSQMTEDELSVQDVHNMVTDFIKDLDFESGLISEDMTPSQELH